MKKEYSAFGKSKRPNHKLFNFYVWAIWGWLKTKVKIKLTQPLPKLPEQFVVVCNHPSGFDNFYCIKAMRPRDICFVSNRYYMFNKTVGKFMRSAGCIPKSIFTSDMESVKNTLAMKEAGAPLGFMPEVRLCMDGEMQKLPESTGKFFKMLKLPIFSCKFDGSYFLKPKWAKKRRKGTVFVTIKQLYDQESLASVSNEQLQSTLEQTLYYNDFEWLKSHPEIKYVCKKQAEGLEKILTVCPHCGQKYTIASKNRTLTCRSCGYKVRVNDRYEFVDDGFEHYYDNFQQWYKQIQKDCWQKVDNDNDFELTEKVTLKLPSKDGKGFLRVGGSGQVTLNSKGLTYVGTKDGQDFELFVPMHESFYLSYGMNLGFQTFVGAKEYYAFCPDNPQKSLDWYLASERLCHNFVQKIKNLKTQ